VDWKALLAEQGDFLRPLAQAILQQVMEAEMNGLSFNRSAKKIGSC